MSIYVFISRRDGPTDSVGPSIAAQEWTALVSGDSAFREPTQGERTFLGLDARVWLGDNVPVAFDWRSGHVEVKNPSPPTIARMIQLARKLRAKVFSESGEVFLESGHHAGFLPGFGQPSAMSSSITPGALVKHHAFGRGKVIDMAGTGDSTMVQVAFEAAGVKWLLLQVASLEIVGP